MANYVCNTLRVVAGDPSEVFEAIRSKSRIFDFQQLVQPPEHIKNRQPELHGHGSLEDDGWLRWASEHWGTTLNACNTEYSAPNAIRFDTPWRAPVPVFEALARRFPRHKMFATSDYFEWGTDAYESFVLKDGLVFWAGTGRYSSVGEPDDGGGDGEEA